MVFIFFMTLPGLAILLTLVAIVDQAMLQLGRAKALPWRGVGRQGQVSATGFEQLHATFSPGKEAEMEQRKTTLMLRDDEGDGAPPRTRVDLDAGTATIRLCPLGPTDA